MLLRRKGMRSSQGTQCQDEGGAGISDVPFRSGAVHSDVPYDNSWLLIAGGGRTHSPNS